MQVALRKISVVAVAIAAFTVNDVCGDLVGDVVTVSDNINLGSWDDSNPTVGAGIESEYNVSATLTILQLDIASSTITFNNPGPNNVIYGSTVDVTVGDLDWVGTPGILTGVTLTANTISSGFDASDISFGSDFVTINLSLVTWEPDQGITMQLTTASIPEPSSFLCLGLVALGFVGWTQLKAQLF